MPKRCAAGSRISHDYLFELRCREPARVPLLRRLRRCARRNTTRTRGAEDRDRPLLRRRRLGERVDPEPLRRLMGSYYDEMRTIVERHGGTVEKFIGDAVMAVFGVPQAHEDDALRAVRAAAEMQAAAAPLELEIRIGINTGEVVTGEGETLVTGDAVNVAARLEQAAAAGETLIGGETLRLVRDAVETAPTDVLELKGKAEPIRAHRVLAVDPDAPSFARRLDRPMVGVSVTSTGCSATSSSP
jgi:class 3 adenylate cyclase